MQVKNFNLDGQLLYVVGENPDQEFNLLLNPDPNILEFRVFGVDKCIREVNGNNQVIHNAIGIGDLSNFECYKPSEIYELYLYQLNELRAGASLQIITNQFQNWGLVGIESELAKLAEYYKFLTLRDIIYEVTDLQARIFDQRTRQLLINVDPNFKNRVSIVHRLLERFDFLNPNERVQLRDEISYLINSQIFRDIGLRYRIQPRFFNTLPDFFSRDYIEAIYQTTTYYLNWFPAIAESRLV